MKTLIRFIFCAAVAVAFAGCHEDVIIDNENSSLSEDQTAGNAGGYLADGYFRATFFPQQGSNTLTRAEDGTEVRQPKGEELRGMSKAIQTLKCFIYREQEEDGSYLLIKEKDVIEYKQGSVNNELWPLTTEVSFDLPNGNYKAVFVGNASDKLFPPLKNEILTGVTVGESKFEDASLNMPETENGLAIFKDVDNEIEDIHNMLYLCTVDFNQDNFNGNEKPPYVLMQRVVSQNLYGRDLIKTNDALEILVNNIIMNIAAGELFQKTLKGLFENAILGVVENAINEVVDGAFETLDNLVAGLKGNPLTYLVGELVERTIVNPFKSALTTPIKTLVKDLIAGLIDELLEQLAGGLLDELNKKLLGPLLEKVNDTLLANDDSLLGLEYLLNPWQHVNAIDVKYNSLTKSIGFDRNVKGYYDKENPAKLLAIPVTTGVIEWDKDYKGESVRYVATTTLCGKEQEDGNGHQHLLSEINVNEESINRDLLGTVSGLVDRLDETLLNGLLVNIHKSLDYPMESNLQYSTRCQLLNVTLSDYKEIEDGEHKVTIDLYLGDILEASAITSIIDGLLNDPVLLVTLKAIEVLVNDLVGGILGLVDSLTGLELSNVTKLVDNLIVALVGDSSGNKGIAGDLVTALTDLRGVDIYLPALNINNIIIDGQWNKTVLSNGDVIAADNRRPNQP